MRVGRLRRTWPGRHLGRLVRWSRAREDTADHPREPVERAAGALAVLREIERREDVLPSTAVPRTFLVRDRAVVAEGTGDEVSHLVPAPLRGTIRRGASQVAVAAAPVAADVLTLAKFDLAGRVKLRAHYVGEHLSVAAQAPVPGGTDGIGNAVRAHDVVRRHSPGLAPWLVAHGRLPGRMRYLVEEWVAGSPVMTPGGLADVAASVLEGMARVHHGHGVQRAAASEVWGDALAARWRRTVATGVVGPSLGRHVAGLIEADRRVRVSWVHGDLIASNVLRGEDDRIVLIDWEHSRESGIAQDAAKLHLFSGRPEETLELVLDELGRARAPGGYTAAEELALAHAHLLNRYPVRRADLEDHARADIYERQVRRQVHRLAQVLDLAAPSRSPANGGGPAGVAPRPGDGSAVEPLARLRESLALVAEAERVDPVLPQRSGDVTLLARDRVVRPAEVPEAVEGVLPPGQGGRWRAGEDGVQSVAAPVAAELVVLGKLDLRRLPKLRAVYPEHRLTLVMQPWNPTGGAGVGRAVRAHKVVGRHAPELIPPMLGHGFLGDGTPYIVERWVPGRPLNNSQRLAEAAPTILAGLAAVHHGHGTTRARLADLWGDALGERWHATVTTGIVPREVDLRVRDLIDRDRTLRCSFVHGDVVASNVLATYDGVVLVDWEHAHEGVLMGDGAKLHLFGADPQRMLDTILATLGNSPSEALGGGAPEAYTPLEELALCHAQLISRFPRRRARLAGHERAAVYERQVRRQLERLAQVLGREG